MLGLGFIKNIRANLIRKKQKKYPTAKPSEVDYDDAKKILKNTPINCQSIPSNEVLDIIAYLVRYKSIVNTSGKPDHYSFSHILATSPWIAQRRDDYYIDHINVLIDSDILKYSKSKKMLYLDAAIPYPKLTLQETTEQDRNFETLYNYIKTNKQKDDYLTLKLSVFHARTFLEFDQNKKNMIKELMKNYPNLIVQVLCVGKYSGSIAQEGADKKHLDNAIHNGMLKLYKLAFWYRGQFKIRIVRNNIEDVSLRCRILMDRNNIDSCTFDVWKPGYDRGISGTVYAADPRSSTALQINRLFDDAFKRAIPAKKDFEWLLFWGRKLKNFIILVIIIVALSAPITNILNNDDFNIFIEVILSLVFEGIIKKIWDNIDS